MENETLRKEIEQTVNGNRIWREVICPRCGHKMSEHPALSRFADVSVCEKCGMAEALLQMLLEADPDEAAEKDMPEWKVAKLILMSGGVKR